MGWGINGRAGGQDRLFVTVILGGPRLPKMRQYNCTQQLSGGCSTPAFSVPPRSAWMIPPPPPPLCPRRYFYLGETLALVDLSLMVKSGVQYSLWGGR